ncbi:MAG TPA: DUF1800 family protein, partial [Burkholderiales bacterium]|nr:DUF1800 family protein [Burkholderiales bacterium]
MCCPAGSTQIDTLFSAPVAAALVKLRSCSPERYPMRIPGRSLYPSFAAPLAGALMLALSGCASAPPADTPVTAWRPADPTALLNRVTWGATPSLAREVAGMGAERYLERQLHPGENRALPAAVQAQIDAMTISQRSVEDIGHELEAQRLAYTALSDVDKRAAAQ